MQQVWVKILQALREQQQHALFALVSSLDDLQFTENQIVITPHNNTETAILKKHLTTLNNLSGKPNTIIINQQMHQDQNLNQNYVAKLRELFGDKIEIL